MCCILYFPIGSVIDYKKLENCVYNNCHSYGAILKNPAHKKLEIIRKCDWENNETPVDPKEVYNLVNDNQEFERYIHLRWRTDGPIDLDNTHPFPVFVSDKRQVYFMHNGILHGYKPDAKSTTYEKGVKVEREAENISDSKKYVDKFLVPLLGRFMGEHGKADISDEFLSELIQKNWSTGSKGILISNDQEAHLINAKDWSKVTFQTKDYWASNTQYFDNVVRGPEFDRRKKEDEENKKRNQSAGRFHNSSGSSDDRIITDLKSIPLKPREPLTKELKDIFGDYRIWEEDGMASLENLTPIEIESLVKDNPDDATNLITTMTCYYADIYKRYNRLVAHMKVKGLADHAS